MSLIKSSLWESTYAAAFAQLCVLRERDGFPPHPEKFDGFHRRARAIADEAHDRVHGDAGDHVCGDCRNYNGVACVLPQDGQRGRERRTIQLPGSDACLAFKE